MKYLCESRLVVDAAVRLRLTPEQLRRRPGLVNEVGPNLYSPLREIEFKAGEIIEVEGELPKSLLQRVSLRGSRKAPEPEAAEEAPARARKAAAR